ncbi:MAG: transcription termination factor Rho, partial [Bacteroidaceae bacterium]|nr:transcription termination factor Rho [Bacteroidaceae bacterium]
MYKLEQLNSKELAELQAIASELGIANVDKLDKNELMFRIIDEQAEVAASSAEKPTRKRTRVSVKNVDRVYSATQNKTKKIDKKMQVTLDDTLFGSLSQEEKDMLTPASQLEQTPPTQEPESLPVEETPAPKKRGRKKKDTVEAPVEAVASEDTGTPAPSKRGRKKKAEVPVEEVPVPSESSESAVPEAAYAAETDIEDSQTQHSQTVITRGSTEISSEDSDFIIIQDIPSIEDSYYNPMEFFKKTPDEPQTPPQYTTPKPHELTPQKLTNSQVQEPANSFDNIVIATGVLEIIDNYGFLRSSDYNYLPSPDDVYVNLQQIKHWGLKQGDVVEGHVRPPRTGEKFFPLVDVLKINGCDPQQVRNRIAFEFLTPLFPDQKFKLCKGADDSKSSRIVDLFSPIGKGQRALIVAQPKTGKTLLMKDIANSIAANHPEAYLMMLLIDERPEEVTDMARTVNAEVIASTFDAPAENHVKIAGIVLEKAKRMVECGHDVVIFLDSITR